jgi:hypothetical protein
MGWVCGYDGGTKKHIQNFDMKCPGKMPLKGLRKRYNSNVKMDM